jgi:hypothetical protein
LADPPEEVRKEDGEPEIRSFDDSLQLSADGPTAANPETNDYSKS